MTTRLETWVHILLNIAAMACQLAALQVSCLMCFAPQLIERNLYADDRFIPTEVGLPRLYLDNIGRF